MECQGGLCSVREDYAVSRGTVECKEGALRCQEGAVGCHNCNLR